MAMYNRISIDKKYLNGVHLEWVRIFQEEV